MIFEVRDLWPQILIDLAGANPNSIYIRILKWIEKHLYLKENKNIDIGSINSLEDNKSISKAQLYSS